MGKITTRTQPVHVRIRPMTHVDIAAVTDIHRRVLPTPTARLGAPVLSRFYRTVCTRPDIHAAFVAHTGTRVVGCITVTRDSARTSRILTPILFSPTAITSVVRSIVTGSVSLRELIEHARTESQIHTRGTSPYPTILTLCVDTASQHAGVGSALCRAIENHMKKFTDTLFVDTGASNTNALSFYAKQGFMERSRLGKSVVLQKKLG